MKIASVVGAVREPPLHRRVSPTPKAMSIAALPACDGGSTIRVAATTQ